LTDINFIAGNTGSVGNPLLQNFILVGRKLEKLGFMYFAGKVMVVKPSSRRSPTDADVADGACVPKRPTVAT